MTVLGVELSDAGILVAGGRPARLLQTDLDAIASPGYALPRKKKICLGREAEGKAQLYPQEILNHFWDQLSTEPLEHPSNLARNQAEVAFGHLTQIWERVSPYGSSVVIAVPDHYTRTQLGLLLGMARELNIPVHGYFPLSIAAVTRPEPGNMLLYLDIHLHRLELTCLRQAERLYHVDSTTLPGKGILSWYRAWVEAIATEFVHATRFDPLHRAETEQALYNRLDIIANDLKISATARIELTAGQTVYRSTISAEQLLDKNIDGLNAICRAIQQMQARCAQAQGPPATLLVSHRIAALPGVSRSLSEKLNIRLRELPEGAAALGAVAQREGTDGPKTEPETVYQKSKPWTPPTAAPPPTGTDGTAEPSPSHILSGSVAHPLEKGPLMISRGANSGQPDIQILSDPYRAEGSYCIIQHRGGRFFLKCFDMPEATINGQPISGETHLKLGDLFRLRGHGDTALKLIACQ